MTSGNLKGYWIHRRMRKERFRIAIVGGCLSSHGGGAPRSVAQQARSLLSHADVTLYAGFSKTFPFTPEELGIENIRTRVSRLWGPSVLGFFPKALFQLWEEAREFDIIHLNGAWNLTTFFGSLIATLRGTPYVISCRSHYGDYHFSRLAPLKKLLFATLERFNIRHAYALHVTSDWEKKTSHRAVSLARRIIKIPNPVNLDDFHNPPDRVTARERLGLDTNAFILIHLGRLGAQKNLSLLLHAFKMAELPETTQLILLGPPETAEKQKLVRLAHELGIDSQIHFIDFAKGRERCDWLAAADLFTLPSNDENFCIATIEAAASGTYSLLSPQVGAVEYMPSSLFEIISNDPESWAEALVRNSKNRPLQQFGKTDWLDVFSQDTITQQWLDFYKTLESV